MIKRIKEFMIEAMNKLNKAYAKLFKKCLVLKESKKKSNVTKRKSKKS